MSCRSHFDGEIPLSDHLVLGSFGGVRYRYLGMAIGLVPADSVGSKFGLSHFLVCDTTRLVESN